MQRIICTTLEVDPDTDVFHILNVEDSKLACLTNDPKQPTKWIAEIRGSFMACSSENKLDEFQLKLYENTLVVFNESCDEVYGFNPLTGRPVFFFFGSDKPTQLTIIHQKYNPEIDEYDETLYIADDLNRPVVKNQTDT